MDDLIRPCGDNCSYCPRHTAQTNEELQTAAELWHKAGLSGTVMSLEKIKCIGCEKHDRCSLRKCLKQRGIKACNQCSDFPCEKINAMLKKSRVTQERCKAVCSDSEYSILHKAFFEKETNLRK